MLDTNYSNRSVTPFNDAQKNAGSTAWTMLLAAPMKSKLAYFENALSNRTGITSFMPKDDSNSTPSPLSYTLAAMTRSYADYAKQGGGDEQQQKSINQLGENLQNLVNYFENPDKLTDKRSVLDTVMISICNMLSSLAGVLSFSTLADKFSGIAFKLDDKSKDNLLKFLSRTLIDPQYAFGELPENTVADSDQKVQNRSSLVWQDGVYKVFEIFIRNAGIVLDDTNYAMTGDREENKRLWDNAYGNLNFPYEQVEKTLEVYGAQAKALIAKQNPVEPEQPTQQPVDIMDAMQVKDGIAIPTELPQEKVTPTDETPSKGD